VCEKGEGTIFTLLIYGSMVGGVVIAEYSCIYVSGYGSRVMTHP
jgi:hypothetical protein